METALNAATELGQELLAALPRLGLALIAFAVLWTVSRFVAKAVQRRAETQTGDETKALVFGRLTTIAGVVIASIIAAAIAFPTFSAGDIVAALGIGGVAVGFAFKDIFENLLAGLILLVSKPFRIGDTLEVEGHSGKVEEIQIRATIIRTFDNRQVVIPNGTIYKEDFEVVTAYDKRRFEYDFGIGYDDDIDKAKVLIQQTINAVDGVCEDPAADVLVVELAGSSVNIKGRWWVENSGRSVLEIKSDVIRRVKQELDASGFDIPYPIRTVYLPDQEKQAAG